MIKKWIRNNKYLNGILSFIYTVLCGNAIRGRTHNSVKYKGAYLKKTRIRINGRNNKVIIGAGAHLLRFELFINGNDNTVVIGENVSAAGLSIVVDDNQNSVTIGRKTVISGNTHLACIEGTSIEIGEDCLFSASIMIRTGDSHSIVNEAGERINYSKSVKLGNHIWIGNTVTILKGVEIKDNSVVATGSVVTKSQESSNVVIAGNPAAIKKTNINWDTERL